MRRVLVMALVVLLLAGSPATPVAADGPPCVRVERDGQVVFEPEGCVHEDGGSQGVGRG